MKKLLLILPVIFLTALAVNAQTEDEVYIGKGKTFGNYKKTEIIIPDVGKTTKLIKADSIITGTVLKVEWCEEDCYKISLRKDDGTVVIIGTKDYGFSVPKNLVGRKINVVAKDAGQISGGRKRKDIQQGIQFAATGIMVID